MREWRLGAWERLGTVREEVKVSLNVVYVSRLKGCYPTQGA